MSLQRYKSYSKVNVAWVRELPSHWDVVQARRVFKQCRDDALHGDEQLSATQKYGVVPQRLYMQAEDQKVMLALTGTGNFKHVEPNDFVISLRSFEGGIEHSRYAGCVSPAYTVLRARVPIAPGFFIYMLKSKTYIGALQTTTDGIRDGKNISYSQFGSLYLPVPPVPEQNAIASFLDRETAKIDALIAEQEKLLTLLAEKRQATISHAVTKGLNKDAPMKDSGVAWMGEVPEHWGVGALGYHASINTGSTPDRGNAGYWNGDIPWLKTGEICWDPIFESEEHITQDGFENSAVKLSPPGTLLMAMYGQGVTRGRVALLQIDATYNQACAAISFYGSIIGEFGRYYFMAAYDFIRDAGNETSQMNLSSGIIGKIKLTIPPLNEQLAIVRWLDDSVAKIDALRAEAERGVTLLQERKSALVTAAVTGKIDVREISARLDSERELTP